MTKTVLVPIADGFEEIEAITIIDVLRRAGAEVTIAAIGDETLIGAHNISIVSDCNIADCVDANYDLIALPGGVENAESLRESRELELMLKRQRYDGRLYAAICAAPALVLLHHELLDPTQATCHPGFADYLPHSCNLEQNVVVTGACVTSRGAGTAMEFALKLVELLFSREQSSTLAEQLVA